MTQEQTKNRRHRSRHGRRSMHARELPNIFFCGDPHGGFDQINEAARLYHPDAMVILGDLQPPAPLEEVLEEALSCTEIWWIPGNHDTDTDEFYDRLWRGSLRDHNLHGRSVMIHGVRIAGLGGVFRGQVWMPDDPPNYFSPSSFMRRVGASNIWRGGVPRRHRSTIFPSVYNNLLHQKADILVTHEAPGCHTKGFYALDKLAKSLSARWIFHGHQHEDREYCRENNVNIRAVGYRGVVNLQGEVVIEAQLDPREVFALCGQNLTRVPCDEHEIVVRDEEGRIHVVPKADGIVPAILPCCKHLVPLTEEVQARRLKRQHGCRCREMNRREPPEASAEEAAQAATPGTEPQAEQEQAAAGKPAREMRNRRCRHARRPHRSRQGAPGAEENSEK